MSPVRKPQNHSGSFTGKFPSLKMKRMIQFESGVEKDFIYLLEYDRRISSYEEQPVCIEYKIDGKKHTYTPDFQAVVGGETWVYECKPEKFVGASNNKIKFDAAEKWCVEKGWGFQVITAELIRAGCRLKNVKHLTGFSRVVVSPQLTAKIYAFFSKFPAARMVDVATYIPENTSSEVYPALFHMAYHHRLIVPLDSELISPLSEIRIL
jgi:TnsA endonuclease N terminal